MKHPAPDHEAPGAPPRMRLDKWLWAARLFKTRALAAEAVERGRVQVNGQPAKPGRELRCGDRLQVRQGIDERTLDVLALSAVRGPAPVAQALYAETAESQARRIAAADARRVAAEPAHSIEQGRPTKRDRRQLAQWQRWSASADDLPDNGPD
ncbi:MAG: RNA-binding S4 domain-containing protein [Betaproteobacteria bacterium]|nr:RNA-binding S4 domain-containing protein [Betaproteobacteria bacterium]